MGDKIRTQIAPYRHRLELHVLDHISILYKKGADHEVHYQIIYL